MSNHITIELCAEDRARIDRLAEAMERKTCDKCVAAAVECMKCTAEAKVDPIQEKLAETLANANEAVEAPKNATGEAETSTLTTEPPKEKEPTAKEPAQAEPTKKVTHAELRAKVIELSAKGLKDQTRNVVMSYAPTVKDVPEDKLTECYEKLVKLEG